MDKVDKHLQDGKCEQGQPSSVMSSWSLETKVRISLALLHPYAHHCHLQLCDPLLMILLAWQHLTNTMIANLLTAHLLMS